MTESPIARFHRLTSYEPGREWDQPLDDPWIVTDLVANDVSRRPAFFKHYDLPRTPLPRDWARPQVGVLDVLAGREPGSPETLDLAALARVLYLSAGVTRYAKRGELTFPFRAAGSAGARFPLEVYVAVPEGGALPPGVHWYDPQAHALVTVGPPPHGEAPALVVTGVPWRTGWRYRERGWRHLYWDAGTMLSHVLALTGVLHPVFPDAQVGELVGADGGDEFALAVVALGPGAPALAPSGPARRGQLDADGVVFPLVTATQRAGDAEVLGPAWEPGAPVDGPSGGAAIDDALLARSSHRLLDPSRSLPHGTLAESMALALRGVGIPHSVIVHAVDGLEPGVYAWPERLVRPGALRDEAYRVALDQGLARDACFVVVGHTPPTDDARAYRTAQLLAGLVGGRLHLAAPAFGAGANGMTFLDSEIAGLLGRDDRSLLWTCVGIAEYRPKVGGMPGAATTVTMTTPRD